MEWLMNFYTSWKLPTSQFLLSSRRRTFLAQA